MGFFSKIFGNNKDSSQKTKQPEDHYKTVITDVYVKVTHPKRPPEQIDWKEIEEIKLINTDEGPFLPDVWMLLIGNNKGCSIPQGSKGWDDVYNIVSKYEGFDFENVIKSASCTDNAEFPVWIKVTGSQSSANVKTSLPEDVLGKIKDGYSDIDIQNKVINSLDALCADWDFKSARIPRCIVFLSNGNYETFEGNLKIANEDWRDIIMMAEYDDDNNQIRDFNKTFEKNNL